MTRTPTPAAALAGRICRPQRVGLFGRRGAGKTTLLTMLYREAAGGRLPGLRLAAADARTADYLADKISQLEAGRPLPATLAETELRFHLYHAGRRLELVVRDYQGEHVALGRDGPVREFLRDGDSVWLCLDADTDTPEGRLRAQQEVEQLVEDYLAALPAGEPHRPMAVVLTKADRLAAPEGLAGPGAAAAVGESEGPRFDMCCHALATHAPGRALFAVSSLGGPPAEGFTPRPAGLAEPLAWLADALQAQDEARLAALGAASPRDLSVMGRCVACFTRRYPGAPAGAAHRRRLAALRQGRLRRRALLAAAVALALVLLGGAYDAWGAWQAGRFAAANADDPAAVRARWDGYRAWHPTRHLLRPGAARAEEELLRDLDARVERRRRDALLADLRRQGADPDADPEAVWRLFQRYHADYPAQEVEGDLAGLRSRIKARRDAERERLARAALAELEAAEGRADLPDLLARADAFLRAHDGTPQAEEARRRRAGYFARLDERDFEAARAYSVQRPLNFQTRLERYQAYLDRHPTGAFAGEARAAVGAVAAEWDKHDFRGVRDHFRDKPAEVKETAALARSYLAAQPHGRFRDAAAGLLRWLERAGQERDYRVVLRRGQFDRHIAWFFSRGPDLSVELEINGALYGPSTIVANRYDPAWDFEFPRPVRWKLGDPVRIRVYDHDYYRRLVVDIASAPDDPFALRLLNGETSLGPNSVVLETDFAVPVLPDVE
jgi:hypothetical protein